MGSNRRPRRGLFLLTAPPSPPLGSDLPDRFFFVFDNTTTTTTAKGEGHAIVVRAFDSVCRKRSDHHHPTVGDLGSDRSKSRSRSKTQSSSPGPRLGSGGVLVCAHRFAFCILHWDFQTGPVDGSSCGIQAQRAYQACTSGSPGAIGRSNTAKRANHPHRPLDKSQFPPSIRLSNPT